ncbi:tRNA (N6-threonylcarbamoyladenosine(37)-N6)-methyltransferase TrmO [Pontiella agarivorans]|uniref:tRNA (N6-threonylcarbamoyladenosine(37)-N6)-methyltransferase TrmO n=1 Tax=Pontiella agarivorans TaxID=3038953 RepID=A0ABU5MYD8_9BACT|nr:tRNA (N6-threonylcarbamoyladenosine(37)-N6)-methyltransferase TrmO [Pontiella agarivorans]MDZ8119192.1 tRNA (N6-threonylcarbamoyladenosine(37)-N6)-methyltransferase TrmO [Pontiella agarivorans]
MNVEFKPIGIIRSCYTDKFGIPRQPGLVKSATATLELLSPFNQPEAFRGLDDFSHLWICFMFHATASRDWKPTVRPPRLGGNRRVGVFASRSNFRPNPIGLSVVELLAVNGTVLQLGGGDFLDGTPVLDIKPYIPYSDSLPEARGGFANTVPTPENSVIFLPEVLKQFQTLETPERPRLKQLITDMLAFNPRPAYQGDDPERVYGTSVFDLEVKWKQQDNQVTVIAVT